MSADLDKALELLRAAKCPDSDCDGFGTTVHLQHTGVQVECCGQYLGHGECCGNGVAGPGGVEPCPAPCQWCHERADLLGEPHLLINPNLADSDQQNDEGLPF